MALLFIDLKSQLNAIRSKVEARIGEVLDHGQYIMGPEVGILEGKLAQRCGSKYCIGVASGTEALLISLMGLGVGPGDEIITSPFSFVATAEVIALLGAKPVFVDIENDTCNIDASKIEREITDRTRAIIPVSLYGQPADMDAINQIAFDAGGLAVIEDAAQSFGSTYQGRASCNLSTIACTSFFPSKPLGCYGDGGAIFTSNEELANIFREIRIHGQSTHYHHSRVGVGGRLDTLQAAILLAKLDIFDDELQRRMDIGELYNRLCDDRDIERVVQRQERTSVFAQYTIFVDKRDKVREALNRKGIPTAVHYPKPLNQQPAYATNCNSTPTPIAQLNSNKVLSLPMSAYIDKRQVSEIVECIDSVTYN